MSDRLDHYAPPGFIAMGLGMIVVAAVAGLSDGVAVTFAVLGAGFVALGGFFGRLAPGERQEFGPGGLKFVLRDLQQVAEEEGKPAEAKVLGELADSADDWFEDYKQQVRDLGVTDPFQRAGLLQETYRRHLRQSVRGDDDARSLNGATIDAAEFRDTAGRGSYLRLHLRGGGVLAITPHGSRLNIADESSIE